MALTINTKPDVYSNTSLWNVTTNLTEGASYQNLRIKANLYTKIGVIASKVQRKGASDFDFTEILRSLCSPFRVTLGGSANINTGYGTSYPSNLITSWTNINFGTLTSTGATINSLIGSGASMCHTNTFSVTAGRLYSLTWTSLTVNSGTRPRAHLILNTTNGLKYELEDDTDCKVFVFAANETDGTASLELHLDSGEACNISTWALSIRLIPTAAEGLCAPHWVKFTEMYENASDVTTSGTPAYSDSRMFFALKGTLDDYICDGVTKKLLTRRDMIGNYYQNPNNTEYGEIQLNFICKLNRVNFKIVVDGGSPVRIDKYNMCGYGVLILNNQSGYPAAGELWEITIENYTGPAEVSDTYEFRLTSRCYDPARHVHLEWANRLGGNETFIFLGGHSETTKAERTGYRNSADRNRLVKATLFDHKRLFAPTTVPGEARAIGDLVQSKNVYLLDGNDRTEEVFVVDDSLKVYDRGELIDIEITIEQ